MDLLPGPSEDAALARLGPVVAAHLGLDDWAARLGNATPVSPDLLADLAAAGVFDAPAVTTEVPVAVELGRALAPLEILAAMLAVPLAGGPPGRPARAAIAAPSPTGGFVLVGPADADVILVWEDDRIGAADTVDVHAVVDSIDPTTPMARCAPGPTRTVPEEVADRAALLVAAFHTGLSRGARDMAVEHARTRVQFDRPIGANQAVKHLLADCATRSEAAWASLLFASVSVAEERSDARFQVAVASRISSDAARRNARTNIQVHGGRGYTLTCPAHLFLVRSRILDVVSGVSAKTRRTLLSLDPMV